LHHRSAAVAVKGFIPRYRWFSPFWILHLDFHTTAQLRDYCCVRSAVSPALPFCSASSPTGSTTYTEYCRSQPVCRSTVLLLYSAHLPFLPAGLPFCRTGFAAVRPLPLPIPAGFYRSTAATTCHHALQLPACRCSVHRSFAPPRLPAVLVLLPLPPFVPAHSACVTLPPAVLPPFSPAVRALPACVSFVLDYCRSGFTVCVFCCSTTVLLYLPPPLIFAVLLPCTAALPVLLPLPLRFYCTTQHLHRLLPATAILPATPAVLLPFLPACSADSGIPFRFLPPPLYLRCGSCR